MRCRVNCPQSGRLGDPCDSNNNFVDPGSNSSNVGRFWVSSVLALIDANIAFLRLKSNNNKIKLSHYSEVIWRFVTLVQKYSIWLLIRMLPNIYSNTIEGYHKLSFETPNKGVWSVLNRPGIELDETVLCTLQVRRDMIVEILM